MCLISLAYRSHPQYPLLVAANRDEYYQRPTAGLHFWEQAPQLAAGRDELAGGTWLGMTRCGRFAAITNHRNPPDTPATPRSRGMLTAEFLLGELSAPDYLQALLPNCNHYAGFNLLLADDEGLFYFSNVEKRIRALNDGIYSISNGLLDSDWPKQRQSETRLRNVLAGPIDHERLRGVVSDRAPADDGDLPDTGVGRALEKVLSSQFIVTPEYGTRATTTVSVDRHGQVEISEASFGTGGAQGEQRRLRFSLDGRE